jgi:hypothetical protein
MRLFQLQARTGYHQRMKRGFEMRPAIVALGFVLCTVPPCMAMPLAPLPLPVAIHVHGCHHQYADDLTGWHRHDNVCRILRGVAGHKGQPAMKT